VTDITFGSKIHTSC